ncbi:MAG: hypothetical protein PHV30_02185 [Candidatus Margulisbacteria bacterium]|nr:hypothetical protein [Candidatus Margulisiibacteriota bacterium]
MSDVVFILGAGASKECGAPLMADFLDTAFDLWKRNEIPQDKIIHFEKVYKSISALQKIHSKSQLDINNIEAIFNTFEMGKIISKLPGTETYDEIIGLINSLKEVIYTTLEKTIKFKRNAQYILPSKAYERFVNLIKFLREETHPKKSVSIITFNYDIALDHALYYGGFDIDYCLEDKKKSLQNTISLLKLHGSLNWALEKQSGQIMPFYLKDYFANYSIPISTIAPEITAPIWTHTLKYFDGRKFQVEREPAIVPPSWNKTDYHKTLSKVWNKAARELEMAEYIFVIGYSMPITDTFFKLLYAIGSTGDVPLRKFCVCNPDSSGKTEERYREMLGPGAIERFNYENITFFNSIDIIKNSFSKKKNN